MPIKQLLNIYFSKYSNDSYCYCRNDVWTHEARKARIPDEPGVYLFIKGCLDNEKIKKLLKGSHDQETAEGSAPLLRSILYIGKAGTIVNGNGFKKQQLKDRIAYGKQFNGRRSITIPRRMAHDNIDYITVLWFVTYRGSIFDLPGSIEGTLMQGYFSSTKHSRLPIWNTSF